MRFINKVKQKQEITQMLTNNVNLEFYSFVDSVLLFDSNVKRLKINNIEYEMNEFILIPQDDVLSIEILEPLTGGYINNLFFGKDFGLIEGYPVIDLTIKKNLINKKSINGKSIINYKNETVAVKVKFSNYPLNGDEVVVYKLLDYNDSLYFYPDIESHDLRLKNKAYLVKVTKSDYSLYKNYYSIPLFNAAFTLEEVEID